MNLTTNRTHTLSRIVTLIALVILPAALVAQQDNQKPAEGVTLTVYHGNFALVKDVRTLDPTDGVMTFRDVAATIDPTSVNFKSLTDPDARILEQNYEFDLVGAEKLLEKYVDKTVTVHTRDGKSYTGVLLSHDNAQLVLSENGGKGPLTMIGRGDNLQRIQFGQLPEGLLTKPTLVWEVSSEVDGPHTVQLGYMARQFKWRADYNLVLHRADRTLDLSGWVTLDNQTGAGYDNAKVKLVAGDTGGDPRYRQYGWGPDYYKTLSTLEPSGKRGDDVSRQLGEYRIYDLPMRTDVNNKQIKQVELIKATGVPYEQTYLYDGGQTSWYRYRRILHPNAWNENKKVNVLIEFENRKARNLGLALPQGKARVFERDKADDSMEFIGEDTVPGTPIDEKVVLYIGDAFDIVGERKQTDYDKIGKHVAEETFEVKIRNHKKEAVTVEVLEKMIRASDWTILWSSVNDNRVNYEGGEKDRQYDKRDARTIVFPVEVKPDGETVVTYKVRYRW